MNCSQNEQAKAKIKTKYPWLSDDEVADTYNMAISDYVMTKYPSENNRPIIENIKFDFFGSQWIYNRMIDILERAGGISLTAYKENGLNLTYGGSYIDPQLVAQIMPKAGVPK